MLRPTCAKLFPHGRTLLVFAFVASGCTDVLPPLEKPQQQTLLQGVSANPYPTLDEEFALLAAEVPGGFAGLYYDATGNLVVALTDVAQRDVALTRLEPALRHYSRGIYSAAMVSSVRTVPADIQIR